MSETHNNMPGKDLEIEASAWIAQLDGGNMTPEDIEAFKEWIGRSPAHKKIMLNLAEVWNMMGSLSELAEPMNVAKREQQILRSNSSYSKRFQFGMMTGFAVLLGFFGTYLLVNQPSNPTTLPAIYATKVGESRTISLDDGSQISMNTNSSLEVDFADTRRKIRLLQGEAIFDVTPDPDRPFTVYARDDVVRAVGTVFSVRLQDTTVDVSVSEGAVEVLSLDSDTSGNSAHSTKTSLVGFVKSGHVAILDNSGTIIKPASTTQIEDSWSWRRGVVTFSGMPLEQAIAEMSRYTTLNIIIDDPSIGEIRIGGVYHARNVDNFFEALELGFGLDVVLSDNNTATISYAND